MGELKKNQLFPEHSHRGTKRRSSQDFIVFGEIKRDQQQLEPRDIKSKSLNRQNFNNKQIRESIHGRCSGLIKVVQRIPHNYPPAKDRETYF